MKPNLWELERKATGLVVYVRNYYASQMKELHVNFHVSDTVATMMYQVWRMSRIPEAEPIENTNPVVSLGLAIKDLQYIKDNNTSKDINYRRAIFTMLFLCEKAMELIQLEKTMDA